MTWQGSLPLIQYVAFPFLLLGLGFLGVRWLAVPRLLLGVAALAALGAFTYTYVWQPNPDKTVPIAKLDGDDIRAQTRKLRERMNHELHRYGALHIVDHPRLIENHEEALQLMRRRNLGALIWGNQRWVRVSFLETEPLTLRQISNRDDFSKFGSLLFVTSVPSIGLSYEPRNETASFIANTLAGMLPSLTADFSEQEYATRELHLLDAATLVSFWSGASHRALAWWALGNIRAFRALRRPFIEKGELGCAVKAYQRARAFIQPHDVASKDLNAAILNNLAIMKLVGSFEEITPLSLKKLRKTFTRAMKAGRRAGVYKLRASPEAIARHNRALFGAKKKKPKVRRRGEVKAPAAPAMSEARPHLSK